RCGDRVPCCPPSPTRQLCFFFSSRRRHTRFDCDWSSDVCSSDLPKKLKELRRQRRRLLDKGQLKTVPAREPDEIPRALSDHLALEGQGWKGRAGSAAGQHAAVRAFMEAALAALAAQGDVRDRKSVV